MKVLRKIIEINEEKCDGCGNCVPSCAEGAIEIIDGKAKLVKEIYCDGLGACLGECPQGALKIIEREADDFDEHTVEQHLAHKEKKDKENMPCGCPSSHIQTFITESPCQCANKPASFEGSASALSHWPIKIRLVPANAPFLKNADLLVLADCSALAYTVLHQNLLPGKVVMMGCPKFDDVQNYIDKFAEIFKAAGIKSITVAFMEVPCCSGLPVIVKKAMEKSGVKIPMTEMVIGAKGNIVGK
jgi:ferredoxin